MDAFLSVLVKKVAETNKQTRKIIKIEDSFNVGFEYWKVLDWVVRFSFWPKEDRLLKHQKSPHLQEAQYCSLLNSFDCNVNLVIIVKVGICILITYSVILRWVLFNPIPGGVSEHPIPGDDAMLHHPAFLDNNWG